MLGKEIEMKSIRVIMILVVAGLFCGCASLPPIGYFSAKAKKHTQRQRLYRASAQLLPQDKLSDAANVIESDMPVEYKRRAIAAWVNASGPAQGIGIGVNLFALSDITLQEAGLELLGAGLDIATYYGAYELGSEIVDALDNDDDGGDDSSSGDIVIDASGDNNTFNLNSGSNASSVADENQSAIGDSNQDSD